MNNFDFEVASVSKTEAVIIEGGPGVGKTHLLLKRLEFWSKNPGYLKSKASEVHPKKNELLYICFNIELAKRVKGFVKNNNLNVEVWSYHAYCEHLVALQNISIEDIKNQAETETDYYENILPHAANDYYKKQSKNPVMYRAIAIDDFGDFRVKYFWKLMDFSLRISGERWLAWDPSQLTDSKDVNAYQKVKNLMPSLPSWKLQKNLRNPPYILNEIKKFKPWFGLLGMETKYFAFNHQIIQFENPTGNTYNSLVEILDYLDLMEFKKSEIVIIGPRYQNFKNVKDVNCFTSGQFKGCESKAVILVGYESRSQNKWLNRHYFMSLSRAKEIVVELVEI